MVRHKGTTAGGMPNAKKTITVAAANKAMKGYPSGASFMSDTKILYRWASALKKRPRAITSTEKEYD
jgi:hypothetical protein